MNKPKRRPYSLPAQTVRTWDEALSSPRDITVEAMETGQLSAAG
jgi:hypothetical protein